MTTNEQSKGAADAIDRLIADAMLIKDQRDRYKSEAERLARMLRIVRATLPHMDGNAMSTNSLVTDIDKLFSEVRHD